MHNPSGADTQPSYGSGAESCRDALSVGIQLLSSREHTRFSTLLVLNSQQAPESVPDFSPNITGYLSDMTRYNEAALWRFALRELFDLC